jgi:hypothetical protein
MMRKHFLNLAISACLVLILWVSIILSILNIYNFYDVKNLVIYIISFASLSSIVCFFSWKLLKNKITIIKKEPNYSSKIVIFKLLFLFIYIYIVIIFNLLDSKIIYAFFITIAYSIDFINLLMNKYQIKTIISH